MRNRLDFPVGLIQQIRDELGVVEPQVPRMLKYKVLKYKELEHEKESTAGPGRKRKRLSVGDWSQKVAQFAESSKHDPSPFRVASIFQVECYCCGYAVNMNKPGQLYYLKRHVMGVRPDIRRSNHWKNYNRWQSQFRNGSDIPLPDTMSEDGQQGIIDNGCTVVESNKKRRTDLERKLVGIDDSSHLSHHTQGQVPIRTAMLGNDPQMAAAASLVAASNMVVGSEGLSQSSLSVDHEINDLPEGDSCGEPQRSNEQPSQLMSSNISFQFSPSDSQFTQSNDQQDQFAVGDNHQYSGEPHYSDVQAFTSSASESQFSPSKQHTQQNVQHVQQQQHLPHTQHIHIQHSHQQQLQQQQQHQTQQYAVTQLQEEQQYTVSCHSVQSQQKEDQSTLVHQHSQPHDRQHTSPQHAVMHQKEPDSGVHIHYG